MKTLTININDVLNYSGRSRFYSWISYQFDGVLIFEAGTGLGNGARFLASNPTNLVVTYDTQNIVETHHIDKIFNVLYKQFDVTQLNPMWLSKVAIVHIDIAHTGVDEETFLKSIDPYFKGILIMDDINDPHRWPKLHKLFNDIEREHHLLPSSIGRRRGTGVIPYGDWTVVIE